MPLQPPPIAMTALLILTTLHAAVDKKSPWRVSQVGYVLVTSTFNPQGKKNTYHFDGNFKKVPEPVRVPGITPLLKISKKKGYKYRKGKMGFITSHN